MDAILPFLLAFHVVAIAIAAVMLRSSIKNGSTSLAWSAVGLGLVMQPGPSVLLASSYPPEVGYVVWFVSAPIALAAAVLWMFIAACVAILTSRPSS